MTRFPTLSVLLPIYNGELFIKQAIQSILEQTYADFELLILNDGSTDNSEEIIKTFGDSRIIYIDNERNKGLIAALNDGIEKARGKYIARMDADDISLPTRFEKQVEYLRLHDTVDVVASTIRFIDINGNEAGSWPIDSITTDVQEIRKRMIRENCIAHPTVMGKASVFRSFRYRANQKNMEDYDLWLRLLDHQHVIAKIKEPLLLYRVHAESVTKKQIQNSNLFFKVAKMKKKFVAQEIKTGHLSRFDLAVAASVVVDWMKGIGKSVKALFSKSKSQKH